MRNLARFAGLVAVIFIGCFRCLAQSHAIAAATQPVNARPVASDGGVVPLSYPYSISTEPHFAIFVEFPKADSIRRIALGDSNYFLAEADKTDPHYAIIKQIEAPPKGKTPIETNMLVYMASGRVVNITLKAAKLEDTAYSIDYSVPTVQPKDDPPPVAPEELAKQRSDEERSALAEKMIADVQKTPKPQEGVVSGGLDLRFYTLKRFGALALVSFDVENTSSEIIDLEDPADQSRHGRRKSERPQKGTRKGRAGRIGPVDCICQATCPRRSRRLPRRVQSSRSRLRSAGRALDFKSRDGR